MNPGLESANGAATPAPRQPRRAARCAEVVRAQRVTPRMVRVTVGGPGLSDFTAGPFTDHYVKLQIPPAGAPYAPPFDPAEAKERLPREHWPVTRTYTLRHWDPVRQELTIDFVIHGDTGTAGRWAASAQPGDLLQLQGPGGAYAPHPDADWHLLIGDASALPAIAVSVARVWPNAIAHVFVELDGPNEQQPLTGSGDLRVAWVQSGDEGAALEEAVRALEFPPGTPQVFLHGEAQSVRRIRRHLVAERHLDPARMSVSGYWKQHRTEDGWRAEKADWNRAVEADAVAGP